MGRGAASFNKVIFTVEYTDIVRKSASRSGGENPHCPSPTARGSPPRSLFTARQSSPPEPPALSNVLTFPSRWMASAPAEG